MNRANEIIENHGNLDELFAIIKHYGVNAQFVSDSLVKEFENRVKEEGEEDTEKVYAQDIVEDLKVFSARF